MKIQLRILFIIHLFSITYCFSQNNDSLNRIINDKNQNDTNRLNAYNIIIKNYIRNKPDTAIILAEKQKQLAIEVQKKKYEGDALKYIGTAYIFKGDYPNALVNFFKALAIYNYCNDKKGTGACFNNIGLVYQDQSKNTLALKYYLKALPLFEEINNSNFLGNCYLNIGNIYQEDGNYIKAMEFAYKSLKLKEQVGDKTGIANCNLNIGIIYFNQSQYNKALEYYFIAASIFNKTNDNEGLASTYTNIGNVYQYKKLFTKAIEYHLLSLKNAELINDKELISINYLNLGGDYLDLSDTKNSMNYYLKALTISKEIGNQEGVASCYANLGELHSRLSNYKTAIIYIDSSLKICSNIKNFNIERLAYKSLANTFSKTGNYKDAYENYLKYKNITDSIFNKENSKQLGDLKTKYAVEQKETEEKIKSEAQQIIANVEKKRQQFVTYGVAGILLLVIIFSGLLFKRFKLTNNQKKIIEIKSKETENQKDIIEEKQKEIIDSINYAQRIQRALLAEEIVLKNNIENYFIYYQPKDIVSGDFYWATKLVNKQFALVTADSTGHGVPGAIMSMLNISCLKEAIESQKLILPDEILNRTRKTIIETLANDGSSEGGKDGMDCSFISFDFKNSTIYYAAANNPIWIVRGTELIELAYDKMPVGKHDRDHLPFVLRKAELQKNDMVYTLTDGFPDQFGGPIGKKFKYKQLKYLLITIAHLPVTEQKAQISSTFNNWKGNMEQVDDVTIIGIKI